MTDRKVPDSAAAVAARERATIPASAMVTKGKTLRLDVSR